ncbi:hypothetical protein Cgig2_020518 [Carnegiea gigantea]|uniref:Gnk2-homologous domain-containing protein n=1 Tax=Carnegiea gigantea TaxID=171969 RepID=A0A9Q1KAR3_9CARY|nr:hypothetical protein Cgig2_020518 [Carnegiea gigantea]
MAGSLITLLSISFLLSLSTLTPTATLSSPLTSFVYGGCSHLKYTSDEAAAYKANLNALLTSLVNSATYSSYNHLTIHGGEGSSIHGLYQCRGDLSMPDCAACVSYSAARLAGFCPGSCGAAIQLLGCFLKYDNDSFVGIEDKTVVMKRCGPSLGDDEGGAAAARDSVLDMLPGGSAGLYRVGGSGEVQAISQCVGDLSGGECNDCVAEAVRQVKVACGVAGSGDMYLGKCYVRYTVGGGHAYFSTGGSSNSNYYTGLSVDQVAVS